MGWSATPARSAASDLREELTGHCAPAAAAMILSGRKVSCFELILGRMDSKKGALQGFGIADHLRTPLGDDVDAAVMVGEGCMSCGGVNTFVKTRDAESCSACGAVSPSQKIVQSSHAKACCVLDDPTACGDDPRADATPVGFESANDAAVRHYSEAGGTTLSTRTRKRLGCCSAENSVKRRAVKDYRNQIAVSPDVLRLNRAVQIQLQGIFEKAGKVHDRLLEHIRRTSFQLIVRAHAHSDVCGHEGCDLSLADIAAQTLASTFVKVLCEQLSFSQGQSDFALSGVEVNRLDFLRLIDCANSFAGNQSGVCVSRSTQAVRLNLATTGPPHPCSPVGQSVAVVKSNSMDSLSGSPVFTIRDSLWNFTKTGQLPCHIRDYCLRVVSSGSISHWLQAVPLPSNVLAAVLLAAAAEKLESEKERADKVLEIAARQNEVSVSLAFQVKTEAISSIRTLFVDLEAEDDDL